MFLLKRTSRLGISLRLLYLLTIAASDFLILFPYPAIGSAKVIIFLYFPKKIFSFFWPSEDQFKTTLPNDSDPVNCLTFTFLIFAFQFNPSRCDWECKGKNKFHST